MLGLMLGVLVVVFDDREKMRMGDPKRTTRILLIPMTMTIHWWSSEDSFMDFDLVIVKAELFY